MNARNFVRRAEALQCFGKPLMSWLEEQNKGRQIGSEQDFKERRLSSRRGD
jgi:hypothetical protein